MNLAMQLQVPVGIANERDVWIVFVMAVITVVGAGYTENVNVEIILGNNSRIFAQVRTLHEMVGVVWVKRELYHIDGYLEALILPIAGRLQTWAESNVSLRMFAAASRLPLFMAPRYTTLRSEAAEIAVQAFAGTYHAQNGPTFTISMIWVVIRTHT